ncbi:winged helix-turn-helix domain-containing protein [Halomonas desiderata]|uniref:helix-turn-helix domain-containing protein n=1 Tax=Billgrantia desiderata TaxID=52021 RepID=UPI00174A57D2|nr:winged helix-turn-helix domain-containing protein [Halomonas desiderata]
MSKEKKAYYHKLSKMKLSGSDYLIFLCLLGHVDYYNRITLKQKDIAELCGMSRPQVSRSIKKLKEVGALEDTKELILHFDLLFRGRSSEYEDQKQILMMQSSPFNKLGREDNWGNADEGLKQKERERAKEELTEE